MKEFLEKNYCSKNCDELIQKECHEGIRTRCLDFEEREKLLKDFADSKLVNGYTYEQLLETIENAKKTVTKEITKLQQESNRLKEQIEKMKCCGNCNNTWNGMKLDVCEVCKDYSKWELKE